MKTNIKNTLKLVAVLFIGLLLGWMLFGGSDSAKKVHNHSTEQNTGTTWTCSMHPQIRKSEPGQCPLCGMGLIPVATDKTGVDPNALQMSENAMKLANIQTKIVGTKIATKELRLNGKIQIDERKLYTQSSHIPGRIENLKINFTGEKVSKGQILAMVYSPELVTAQEELLQAFAIKNSQPELFEAAKQKLKNWKIGESTINKIISSGKTIQQFPITADVSGIVTAKKVDLGDYITRGMPIYEITDLSSLWVLFDVYESDMTWVKVGDKISYTVASIPGKTFDGTISFVDPLINSETRVATARVELKNVENKLMPEMFVSGIVKNYLSKTASKEIIIPKTAVMWTGERSIIYIKKSEGKNANFTLREVLLGPSLGDAFVIKSGLEIGEEIVVNGTFMVDAASQLAGKPSMMHLDGGKPETGHAGHGKTEMVAESNQKNLTFSQQLNLVFKAYEILKNSLIVSDGQKSQKAAQLILNNLKNTDEKLITNSTSLKLWKLTSLKIVSASKKIASTKDIKIQREHFLELSNNLIKSIETFGIQQKVFVAFCPMANSDKGASWISSEEKIQNPYFGAAMIHCGSIEKTFN